MLIDCFAPCATPFTTKWLEVPRGSCQKLYCVMVSPSGSLALNSELAAKVESAATCSLDAVTAGGVFKTTLAMRVPQRPVSPVEASKSPGTWAYWLKAQKESGLLGS